MNAVHRLGAAVCVAAAALWLVHVLRSGWRERAVRRRLRALLGTATRATPARGAQVRHAVRRWAPVAGAACAGYALVGGVAGCLAGALAGYGALRWRQAGRTGAPVPSADPDAAARQLPLAADLLAACIAAGADPVSAAQAVGGSLGGPVGEWLAWGAAEVRLGGEPADAWRRLAAIPGAQALARLLERTGVSGAPTAVPVARLATEARAEWGRTAAAKARRAGVLITAPVGLCFLPAFIAVGVVPVLIGLAGGVLGGGGG
ncbi:type II secretion system F family protein [Streptomyces jeddahensis]|uniref:Bacterial type II secretion system protein F domain protein n=1 Tax=Streptomyces jeddahensis TaxID=1716141 RepID=A0A177HKR5_9ACTN|nr:type II secretion system F family protein [Streptomyces jeddahensis]OAH11356.1 bacterial type II secretion system protein F domain protein [Streptomyces jeddahensis]